MFIPPIPNRDSRPAVLLREGYRQDGKVQTRTLANLTGRAPEQIDTHMAVLMGEAVGADSVAESTRPYGHVLAGTGMIHQLGLDKLRFGKRHHLRELSLAQVLAPGAEPNSQGEVLGPGELGKAIDPANPGSSQ